MKKIAIFASGSGSNAERIFHYFAETQTAEIVLFLTNNPAAGVIERGQRLGVPTVVFSKKIFTKSNKIAELLQNQGVDYIILGGFLWLIPQNLLDAFPNRIINIHPSLLPRHGGKGMWGHHVHEAVVAARDEQSGITIHLVNEEYDKGRVLAQFACPVTSDDTPETVAQKVQLLEHEHFPKVIENYLRETGQGNVI